MDTLEIIGRFYEQGSPLWDVLVRHSQAVADYAVRVAQAHPELNANVQFVREAAMLHDIGIIKTHAPSIHCHGKLDYICHGVAGSEMMQSIGLDRHALVCERHTGAGLSIEDIMENNLPLPHRNLMPLSIEEQIVCYADKFFSKTHLDRQKTFEQALHSVAKHGDRQRERLMLMHQHFGIE